jgi:hypothetical protein
MTLGSSSPLSQIMTLRQDNEPGNPVEGMLWVDTSGNNVERKQWTGSQWELDVAVGPDTPKHTVEGARWSKTDTDEVLVYDGAAWASIGVTDHANLDNVTEDQHHERYADSEARDAVSVCRYMQVSNDNSRTRPVQKHVSKAWVFFGKSGNQYTELRDQNGNTLKSWANDNNDGGYYNFSEIYVDHVWFNRTHSDPADFEVTLA